MFLRISMQQMLSAMLLVAGASAFQSAPAHSLRAAGALRTGAAARRAVAPLSATSIAEDKDKIEVEEYFNGEGFSRWNRIYSDSDDVNKVQLDIRTGHDQTIAKVLRWVDEDGSAKAGKSFCDAGCGVGSLAVPLAQRGAKVQASDISAAMVAEASSRAKDVLGFFERSRIGFKTADLESLSGKYDTVTCIDVMIHYPSDRMADMVAKLGSMASDRLIISFAPKTPFYVLLKKIGSLAPGPSKATRAYLHTEQDVLAALKDAGFEVTREDFTGSNFYFSKLYEAKRV